MIRPAICDIEDLQVLQNKSRLLQEMRTEVQSRCSGGVPDLNGYCLKRAINLRVRPVIMV